jgi:hypothetical protein
MNLIKINDLIQLKKYFYANQNPPK